jgi:hypothetical protein
METDLKSYFEKTEGTGILATSDAEGNVNLAIYARPHILEDGNVAMIMRENPKAAYLFMEQGPGYKGCRLYLTRIGEEKDMEKIKALKRRCPTTDSDPENNELFLVTFRLDKTLPLIAPGKVR